MTLTLEVDSGRKPAQHMESTAHSCARFYCMHAKKKKRKKVHVCGDLNAQMEG